MPRLLLIDGHSLAYRAFYALPVENFATASGQATNAVYGFSSMLLNLLKEISPSHVAVAFDVSRQTHRSEKFAEYKAQRAKTPDEFRSQLPIIDDFLAALGIPSFAIAGFEADDLIATLATQAGASGAEVLISTGDRDAFQLVDENITVLYPRKGMSDLAWMTPAAILEKYGLTPAQYPDFAALRGDPSDNLPSIPGVGEKTATKWIQEHGSLHQLVLSVDQISGKVGDSLRANLATVLLNRELTELHRNVPGLPTWEELAWGGADFAATSKILEGVEIRTLSERIRAVSANPPAANISSQEVHTFRPVEVISATQLLATLKTAPSASEITILEITGSSDEFAITMDGTSVALARTGELAEIFTNPKISKVVFNAKNLWQKFPELTNVNFDVMLAAYIDRPGARSYELGQLVQHYLGRDLAAATPADLFSESDPSVVAELFALAQVLRTGANANRILQLLSGIELPTAQTLAAMENRGIHVDLKALTAAREKSAERVASATSDAHNAAGHEFNVASPKQLQVVLFEELSLPKTKKIKTGYTTDADSLNELLAKTGHPVLLALLQIRAASKLVSTIDGLIAAISGDGRIHTTFSQTAAATGRLSSIEPNLQNIPVRTEEGRAIRATFTAGEGFDALVTVDYSQIEMRIMAHLSQDQGLIAAFKSGEDLHSTVASEVFGVGPNQVTAEMRRQIKAMSYGLAYGLSAYGLSQQLDLTPPAAAELMERYFQRFGGIRDYLAKVVNQARVDGFTETIMGRRRYLPELNSEIRAVREAAERMALNSPIQGSAADLIKVAMNAVERELKLGGYQSRLLLQVHDELILEVVQAEIEAVTDLVQREMASAAELSVPLAVNIGVGVNWESAAH